MNKYVIFTDSSCDLSKADLEKRGVVSLPLSLTLDGARVDDLSPDEVYCLMRSGHIIKTSAVNPDIFASAFEEWLKKGYDILYLGLSSALSATFKSACIARNVLKKKYQKRSIITVDTFCASGGVALLIDLVIEKKNDGATIYEAADYADSIKGKISHWFTVDDLIYLKSGGRIRPSEAFFGNMLGIKPILHVNDSGMLAPDGKVRGRRTAIITLADKVGRECNDKSKIYISHADCERDARMLAEMIKEKYGYPTRTITDIGSVIGAHSGPGTLAVFYIGERR